MDFAPEEEGEEPHMHDQRDLSSMAAVQQRVLNWLYSILTSDYRDVNRSYTDVAQTLSYYSSLTPTTEVFTYDTGTSALLLHISGTLPVTFRGTTYRFPVSLWIPHAYPREAPLAYVIPAEGMMIRAGQHVDPQGRIYHPYLVGWAEFWDKSNILDFLAILRDVFAKEPPVISRQQRNAPPNTRQPTLVPPLVPPLPPEIAASSSKSSTSADGTPRPPPPPPKNYGSGGRSQTLPPSTVGRREDGPPLPPLPSGVTRTAPQNQSPNPAYQNGQQPVRQSSLRYETAPPIPQQASPQAFRSPPYSASSNDSKMGNLGAPRYSPPPPPPVRQYDPGGQDPPWDGSAFSQSNLRQQQAYLGQSHQLQRIQQQVQPSIQPKPKPPPPPDIIDQPLTLLTPSDMPLVAPPIPPNPEKDMLLHSLAQALYAQRQHSVSQTSTSLPSLLAQRSSMLHSLTAMNSEIQALESLSAVLASNASTLHTSLRDADAVIKSSQGRAPPGVDEILVAPTVVGNQLYELVCEERSLGDALFVLSRAVERGRVVAGVFTKATRSLAREWYLKKALVKKIGRGMGLVVSERGIGYGR